MHEEFLKFLCDWKTDFLFRCDEKALEDSLCKRVIVTRDDKITKALDPVTAALNRDALAKTIYSRLFDWYVLHQYLHFLLFFLILAKKNFLLWS